MAVAHGPMHKSHRRPAAEALNAHRVQARLKTRLVGRHLMCLTETSSTNDEARRLAEAGTPEGTVVTAEYQTHGRGRMGRRWEAPPGSSLLCSIVLRPSLHAHQIGRLGMACGLAVTDAIEESTGLPVQLKWPNDFVLEGAKLGGMLTELGLVEDRLDYAVVGIGLNVNLDPAKVASHSLMPVTSLSHALGHPLDRLGLLVTLLQAIERRYLDLLRGWIPHREWCARLSTLGQRVAVTSQSGVVEGLAEAVDEDGALLLRSSTGSLLRIVAGDVTLAEGSIWRMSSASGIMAAAPRQEPEGIE